ncbi:MAG: energy transducer TonB [Nitrospira sp. SB0662_bin_26]|nr:energy transducer TonB [Nitrospira sp. SB0662_bin_26]
MNEFGQDSSFLRFGTWSLVVHVLFFVFVSFVHFSLQVEKPPPTVKVTFVEVPAPPPPPEPEPQAPAMRQAQRMQPQPVQRKQIQPTPQPPDIAQPVEMPKVAQTPPPQQPPPQPMKRRLLQDNRATDTLQARNLTKTASRKTTTKTTTKVEAPSMFVPGFSTVAALRGAANRQHIVRSSLPPTTPGRGRRTLQASASGEAQTSTSVGVLRSVHPIYPRIAKKSGWEGTVLLRVTVETNGRASKVDVSRSSGRKVLDDAAVKAVRRWTFRPARDGNIPIRTQVVIPIKFSLDKA